MNTQAVRSAEQSEHEIIISKRDLTTADWRWAAAKGFWDATRRCWNEEAGGKEAYLAQRNKRILSRIARRQRCESKKSRRNCEDEGRLFKSNGDLMIIQASVAKGPPKASIERFCIANNFEITLHPSSGSPDNINTGQLVHTIGHYWPQLICRRYWTLGYQAKPILEIFRTLPLELLSSISETLSAAERCAEAERQNLGPLAAHTPLFVVNGASTGISGSTGEAATDPQWDDDADHGFIRVRLNPVTQDRVAVAANRRSAELLGMRRAELLARFAAHDAPLGLAPLDAVRAFLHGLGVARDHCATRYYRMLLGPGRGAALVCVTSARIFDDQGRLCQVPPPAVMLVEWSNMSNTGQICRILVK